MSSIAKERVLIWKRLEEAKHQYEQETRRLRLACPHTNTAPAVDFFPDHTFCYDCHAQRKPNGTWQ